MSWKKFQIVLFIEQFLIKGWEIGILLLLPILLLQGKISLFELGVLSTVLSISQFGASLFSGKIMNRLGNKKMMLMSIVLGVAPWMILGIKPNIAVMVLLYLLTGASSGLFETCGVSITAKSLGQGKRSEGLGTLAMMGDAGRILFTAMTTITVAYFGLSTFSALNLLLGIIVLLVLFFKLEEIQIDKDIVIETKIKSSKIIKYFKNKNLVVGYIVSWLDSFSSASLFIFLPLLFASKGLPYEESGFLSVLLFVGYMMGRKVLGKLADKIGTLKTLMIGETFMAVVILAIILSNNFFVLMFLLLLLGLATRGTSPVCKALIADAIPDELSMDHGLAIGQSGSRLAGIISRPIFSGVAGLWGIPWVFAISAISALLINVPLRMKKY